MYFLSNQLHLLGLELDNYDSQKDELIVRDIILYGALVGGEAEVDIDQSIPFEKHINDFEDFEWEQMEPQTKKSVKKLMRVGKTILKFKKDVSESRFSELKKVAQQYQQAYEFNKAIERTQNELANTINGLVKERNLYENEYFYNFLRNYQKFVTAELILQSDNSFSFKTKFLEAECFYEDKNRDYSGIPKTHPYYHEFKSYLFIRNSYHEAISYLLVEFLMPERNRNLFYKCSVCNKYFIAGKSDRRIKFCSICSPKSKMGKKRRKEYQRKYRQKKKQEKLAIEREDRIEHLMKKTGYSREEAVEFIEADSKM